MKNLKNFQLSSGQVFYILLTMIFVGLFGRWVFVPAINNLHQQKNVKSPNDFQIEFAGVQKDCISKNKCLISDLLNPYFLQPENQQLARAYILENLSILKKENLYLTYLLIGHFINNESFEFLSGTKLNTLNEEKKAGLFEGLFHCPLVECKKYFEKNKEYIKKNATRIQYLKILLKQEGSWVEHNKELDELLGLIVKNETYIQLISLIEYIPNHPKLRANIEKYYLKIFGQRNINKAAFHLARYNQGWHDRKFNEVFTSKSSPHIDGFIEMMKVGCPQKINEMKVIYFNKLNAVSQKLFLNEVKLFADDDNKNIESKCVTGNREN